MEENASQRYTMVPINDSTISTPSALPVQVQVPVDQQQQHDDKYYDYIIIGGGTSAMGLLNGLLLLQQQPLPQPQSNSCNDNKNNDNNSNNKLTNHPKVYTIAVIERGSTTGSSTTSSSSKENLNTHKYNDDTNDTVLATDNTIHRQQKQQQQQQQVTDGSTHNHYNNRMIIDYRTKLCNWTKASQWYNSLSTTIYKCQLLLSNNIISPCTNSNTNQNDFKIQLHRNINLCVGSGLGGTTNINAGILLMSPYITKYNNDFVQWPITIQNEIQHSIQCIVDTMEYNNCIHYTTTAGKTTFSNSHETTSTTTHNDDVTTKKSCIDQWWDTYNTTSTIAGSSKTTSTTDTNKKQEFVHVDNSNMSRRHHNSNINRQIYRSMCSRVPCSVKMTKRKPMPATTCTKTSSSSSSISLTTNSEQGQAQEQPRHHQLRLRRHNPETSNTTSTTSYSSSSSSFHDTTKHTSSKQRQQLPPTTIDTTNNNNSNNNNFQRCNYYDALVAPILQQQQQEQSKQQQQQQSFHYDNIHFYTNYTAQRLLFDTKSTIIDTFPTCIGTEILCNITGRYRTILARKEVIVCTGTIETPTLLLLSGIGRNIDLPKLNQQQSQQPQHSPKNHSIVSKDYKGYVGGNLRDHIIVPRVYWNVTNYATKELSLNCVREISNITIVKTKKETTQSNKIDDSSNNNNKNCSQALSPATGQSNQCIIRGQYILTDATSLTEIIPLVTSEIIHYSFSLLSSETTHVSTPFFGIIAICISIVNTILDWIRYTVRALISIIVCYTPLYYLFRYCITIVLVSMTNCQSTGSVQIRKKTEGQHPLSILLSSSIKNNNNNNNNYNNEIHTTTASTTGTAQQPIIPLRREQFDVHIDLNYFSNYHDKDALVEIWNGSTDAFSKLSTRTNGSAFEIFPRINTTTIEENNNSNNSLCRYGRYFALSYYHYVGTCRMKYRHEEVQQLEHNMNETNHCTTGSYKASQHGNDNVDDDDWVVDEKFRVREIKSLRICDASIFPTHISSPTALTCAALGHTLAKQILAENKIKCSHDSRC